MRVNEATDLCEKEAPDMVKGTTEKGSVEGHIPVAGVYVIPTADSVRVSVPNIKERTSSTALNNGVTLNPDLEVTAETLRSAGSNGLELSVAGKTLEP